MVKVSAESKHKLSYSGRVKTLCLQKNTALWIGTGGGHILLLDLSTRRIIRIIHNFCDSVRVMMTAQLGKFLFFRSFLIWSEIIKICFYFSLTFQCHLKCHGRSCNETGMGYILNGAI